MFFIFGLGRSGRQAQSEFETPRAAENKPPVFEDALTLNRITQGIKWEKNPRMKPKERRNRPHCQAAFHSNHAEAAVITCPPAETTCAKQIAGASPRADHCPVARVTRMPPLPAEQAGNPQDYAKQGKRKGNEDCCRGEKYPWIQLHDYRAIKFSTPVRHVRGAAQGRRCRLPIRDKTTQRLLQRSLSPITISMLPRIETTSPTMCPGRILGRMERLTNDGARIFKR